MPRMTCKCTELLIFAKIIFMKKSSSIPEIVGNHGRTPGKCPWDRKQTIASLRYLTIEETYELSESILQNDLDALKKELGDLMLHIVFYSKIASETHAFDIKDVLNNIIEKLIHRHPHIFGDVVVKDAKEVHDNWERIKLLERAINRCFQGAGRASCHGEGLPDPGKGQRSRIRLGAAGTGMGQGVGRVERTERDGG